MSWAPRDGGEQDSDSSAGPVGNTGTPADGSSGRVRVVSAAGAWYSFPATGTAVDWVRVGSAPGAFTFRPDRVYGFHAHAAVTDADLEEIRTLAGVATLVILVLGDCGAITDTGLLRLKELTSLHALDLTNCRHITDAGIAALAAALPECEITIE
ncbi:unnamed protein product [Gemmata massiliana]|uniref:Uncharacterized protein n=1 Tax=Gemmata massiliana TaxID=1210884 RepID=A0A6P2D9A1_9BACT|nr:hypothetical protein [Gemmata massiliana]VTR96082.1 unnamed protein product [Gemmata massiliana]